MKIRHEPHHMIRQRGATLAISLIILLVLTIIGVSTMNTTLHEEKMTGNLRDQQVAFQCAEAALPKVISAQIGEKKVADFNTVIADAGFYGLGEDKPTNYFSTALWGGAGEISEVLPGMKAKFLIEILENTSAGKLQGSKNFKIYGQTLMGTIYAHRVTVRCTGQSGTAVAMIQAYYGTN